jgi:hypothetical protein
MTPSSIISVVLFVIVAFALCECCYALGRIDGKRKGIKQGIEMCRKVVEAAKKADEESSSDDE